MKIYRLNEFAKLIGKSVQTLQRWDREGIFKAYRNKLNRRYYIHDQYLEYIGQKASPEKKNIVYYRVSSSGQKGDLENQKKVIEQFCIAQGIAVSEWLSDIGSGLNYTRKNFLSLMEMVERGEVAQIIIAHKGRVVRFGYMKKTIKNYCFNATQSKLNELYEIALRYTSVKNEIFQRYGSISGLNYLSYPRQIRNEWVKTNYANKFGLQARYWKQAVDEVFSNIKSNWSNGFRKIKNNIYKNKNYTEVEKHYAFYLLNASSLLYKAITFQSFDLPEIFKDKDIRRDKIHKYLKSRSRKYLRTKSYQNKNRSFQIDRNMYDIHKDNKGRTWIGIMGLTPRKRVRLQMTSSTESTGNLRIVLKGKHIEIHQAEDIQVNPIEGKDKRAIDKGFSEVITSSSGRKYGEQFNQLLKKESDRLSEKNKKRNKIRALTDKYEKKGDIVKSEIIKKNNLGKRKYFYQKEINLNEIKQFINLSLNRFITEERPAVMVTEDLRFTNWNKKLSKNVKRYFSSWLKGYLQERIDYKTMLNGVQQVVVNSAYGSQICHLCGRFGVRNGDKFYCEVHGVLDADHNAALNYLARMSDPDITVYTPYRKVKDILQERLRLSNQDSRYSVIKTGQSESERTDYV